MRIHHLNCGSMNPATGPNVCHVLVLETDNGLVLVDSGFGLADIATPGRRIGVLRHLIKPVLDEDETAIRQIERMGFHSDDVRHILLTHFDFDHSGGIADFPHAQIHATQAEVRALTSRSPRDRIRYRRNRLAHGAQFVEHSGFGESWRGLGPAKELTDIAEGIVMIDLPGHTRGHACIAVDTGSRWILHTGDAFYHPGTIDRSQHTPAAVAATETLFAHDRNIVRRNHELLRELFRRDDPDLLIVNAHSPELLDHARALQQRS